MRRLPGPADCRLSEGESLSGGSLRIVSGLAENTNSRQQRDYGTQHLRGCDKSCLMQRRSKLFGVTAVQTTKQPPALCLRRLDAGAFVV